MRMKISNVPLRKFIFVLRETNIIIYNVRCLRLCLRTCDFQCIGLKFRKNKVPGLLLSVPSHSKYITSDVRGASPEPASGRALSAVYPIPDQQRYKKTGAGHSILRLAPPLPDRLFLHFCQSMNM